MLKEVGCTLIIDGPPVDWKSKGDRDAGKEFD